MNKKPQITEVSFLMEYIDKISEGLDKKILQQAVQLTDDDFSNPMTAEELLEELKGLGNL